MSDVAPFVFYELKRHNESIVAEILCRECYEKAPEQQHPLTDAEKAKGYRYIVRPYVGEHECMQCEKKPGQPDPNAHAHVMGRDQSAGF